MSVVADEVDIVKNCFLKNLSGIRFKAREFRIGLRRIDLVFEYPPEEWEKITGKFKPCLVFVEVAKVTKKGVTRQLLTALGQSLYTKMYEKNYINYDHDSEYWVAFIYRGADPHQQIIDLYKKYGIFLVGIRECDFLEYHV